MFVFSADPDFHSTRREFQSELTDILRPVLGGATMRVKAARGIFGGSLPTWWTTEDQGQAAEMPADRYGSSAL